MQQAQRSKRVVAERLLRHQSVKASTRAVCVGARLENPLGMPAARSVEACLKAPLACSDRRDGSGLLPDVAEQLATGAQENALQHLLRLRCTSALTIVVWRFRPMTASPIRKVPCEKCGAEVGSMCEKGNHPTRWERASYHAIRVRAYNKALREGAFDAAHDGGTK